MIVIVSDYHSFFFILLASIIGVPAFISLSIAKPDSSCVYSVSLPPRKVPPMKIYGTVPEPLTVLRASPKSSTFPST